jgi:hypothetical protein
MLTILGRSRGISGFCDGFSRRGFLKIGGAAMGGLALNEILALEASAGVVNSHKKWPKHIARPARTKSCSAKSKSMISGPSNAIGSILSQPTNGKQHLSQQYRGLRASLRPTDADLASPPRLRSIQPTQARTKDKLIQFRARMARGDVDFQAERPTCNDLPSIRGTHGSGGFRSLLTRRLFGHVVSESASEDPWKAGTRRIEPARSRAQKEGAPGVR